jgi:hypothetical protein
MGAPELNDCCCRGTYHSAGGSNYRLEGLRSILVVVGGTLIMHVRASTASHRS